MKYEYTDDMEEISGFGGGYETVCRAMVRAGMEWFDANPNADPQYNGFKGIYGIAMEDNDHAKALSKAMVDAANGDCTGAMHQATVQRVLYVQRVGWEQYVKECKARADD